MHRSSEWEPGDEPGSRPAHKRSRWRLDVGTAVRNSVVAALIAVAAGAGWNSATETGRDIQFSFQPISTKSVGVTHSDADNDRKPGIGPGPRDFTISAVVRHEDEEGNVTTPFLLYPGATAELALTVTNASNQPVDVRRLTVTSGDAAAGCPASLLTVGTFEGSLVVPRNGAATTVVPIELSGAAPNSCKAVGFPLLVEGEGTKVSRT